MKQNWGSYVIACKHTCGLFAIGNMHTIGYESVWNLHRLVVSTSVCLCILDNSACLINGCY